MNRTTCSFLLIAIFSLIAFSGLRVSAQQFDPYARVTDPRAITRLDNLDSTPQYCSFGNSVWNTPRDADGITFILAQDAGHAGIVTHTWLELYNEQSVDSTTVVKLYVDDSLITQAPIYDFFEKPHSTIRAPFDSIASGGLVCDLQISYRRNFKITYYAPWSTCCLFWGITWKHIQDSNAIESFRLPGSPRQQQQQTAAEQAYWNQGSPWLKEHSITYPSQKTLNQGDTVVLGNIDGPGLINTIHIQPDAVDSAALRNVWLEMNWDNSPYPSVRVPLPDVFGCGVGPREVKSFRIKADTLNGYTSYFPMPFYVHASIRLINRSTIPISFVNEVLYTSEPVDRAKQGYFAAQFNEDDTTRYKIEHHVGSALGRGRFVGMMMDLPWDNEFYYLEGDPMIKVDSNSDYDMEYTGTEDYIDGGWFFTDGPFSLPFAGCPYKVNSIYRLHILDALEFDKSFDFGLIHGVDNDYKAWYRTIGFFYIHWTPFWVSRDSIRSGEAWDVSGSGYPAGATITGKLDSSTIFQTHASSDGSFTQRLIVPAAWKIGMHTVSVNGEPRPQPIFMLAGPAIRFVHDSIPGVIRWRDTLLTFGTGFAPGEHVTFFVDTASASSIQPVIVDSSYTFAAVLRIPWLPDGVYRVHAQGDLGNKATSDSAVRVTRALNYECEDLWPPLVASGFAHQDYMGYFWPEKWSQQYYALLIPNKPGDLLQLPFSVPVSDTFQVTWYGTHGPRCGIYDIMLDATHCASFDGYDGTVDWNHPKRTGPIDLGTHYLNVGVHSITFTCTGKDSLEYLLGADNFILTPVTPFHPLPVSQSPVDTQPSVPFDPKFVRIWPNPLVSSDELHLNLDLGNVALAPRAHCKIELFDMLGRTISQVFDRDIVPLDYLLNASAIGLANGSYLMRFHFTDSKSTTEIVRGLRIDR